MNKCRPSESFLHAKSWEEKAQENPLYAVMSVADFVKSNAEPSTEELELFFADGQQKVDAWIHPWLQETKTQPNSRILEFGCGMGRLLRGLMAHISPANLYGVDVSPTMIANAKRLLGSEFNLKTIDDHGRIPFDDEYFDRLYSYAVFQHIKHKSVVIRSIAEIARVLKIGGFVKLNFEMVYPPRFDGRFRLSDSHAFESRTLTYGSSSRFGVPLWRLRMNQSDNWTGIRLGYGQLWREFANNGLAIYGVQCDPIKHHLVWFYAQRVVQTNR